MKRPFRHVHPTIAVGVGAFTIRSILTLRGQGTMLDYYNVLDMLGDDERQVQVSARRFLEREAALQTSPTSGNGVSSRCTSFRNLARWATTART